MLPIASLEKRGVFRAVTAHHSPFRRYWFAHFHMKSPAEYGAVPLQWYLLRERNSLWEKLKWTQSRKNPPGLVAKSPYLFMELDVVAAVELLRDRMDFWDGYLFRESLRGGEFFVVDTDFFVGKALSFIEYGFVLYCLHSASLSLSLSSLQVHCQNVNPCFDLKNRENERARTVFAAALQGTIRLMPLTQFFLQIQTSMPAAFFVRIANSLSEKLRTVSPLSAAVLAEPEYQQMMFSVATLKNPEIVFANLKKSRCTFSLIHLVLFNVILNFSFKHHSVLLLVMLLFNFCTCFSIVC